MGWIPNVHHAINIEYRCILLFLNSYRIVRVPHLNSQFYILKYTYAWSDKGLSLDGGGWICYLWARALHTRSTCNCGPVKAWRPSLAYQLPSCPQHIHTHRQCHLPAVTWHGRIYQMYTLQVSQKGDTHTFDIDPDK